jgi:DNA-binding MarR family transcriptional regulator/ribosomal protein S18 acetylase RimI-like enzyme
MEGGTHMQTAPSALIHAVRRFNRFYTNILGLLNHHLLNSDYSLPEARVLYELYSSQDITSKKLTEELKIDSGYLSRIIKRMEKQGLLYRMKSAADGRAYPINLTDKGKETFRKLDGLSDKQIGGLMTNLNEDRRERLMIGMHAVEAALADTPAVSRDSIMIRSDLRPGDAGYLIYLHGWIYDKECGYDHEFEGYVCKTFHDFFDNYSPQKDRIFLAEADGKIIGAIAVVGHTAEKAQLRWFILHPDYRGLGLGSKLMGEAMAYCHEKGYKDIFLYTTQDQQTAIRMYEKAGFQKAAAHETHMWGKQLVELTYELHV